MTSFGFPRISGLPRPMWRCVGVAALLLDGGCAARAPLMTPSATAIAVEPRRDPACVGACLEGKDPFDTGCTADARTVKLSRVVAEDGQTIGVVELRTSPACETIWARVVRTDGRREGEIFGGITVDGGASWLTYRAKHAVSLWTDMRAARANGCFAASAVLYDLDGRALADETWASHCAPAGRSKPAGEFRMETEAASEPVSRTLTAPAD